MYYYVNAILVASQAVVPSINSLQALEEEDLGEKQVQNLI